MPTATPITVSAKRRIGCCHAWCGFYGYDDQDHGRRNGGRDRILRAAKQRDD